jgi:hypothetical protein
MRKHPFVLLVPVLSFGVIHCVADDPTTDSSITDGGGNGDSTISGGDGSTGDGSTGNPDGSTPPNDACIGNPNCPTAVEASSLKLWLRGNVGVTCTAGRVEKWVDQSLSGNDGLPANFHNPPFNTVAVSPQCGTEKIDSHEVVTFTAPTQDAASPPLFIDETMTVNLGWLVNSDYTVFVVHRRKVDSTFGLVAQDIGTDASGTWTCHSSPGGYNTPDLAFALGYQNLSGGTNPLYHAQHCMVGDGRDFGSLTEFDASTFASGTTEVDEVVHATASGNQIYANGSLLASTSTTNDKHDLEAFILNDAGLQGYVGRASQDDFDTRYQGDIAEIVGYARALTDDERGQIEAYLKVQWALTF